MLYGKLLLKGIPADASVEEIDRYVTMLFDTCFHQGILVTGFIRDMNGTYMISSPEVISDLKEIGLTWTYDFDFLNYVSTTNDNDFWLVDYQNVKGPTLMRYHR